MEKDKLIDLLKKIQKESDIPLSEFIKILKNYILVKEEGDVDRALELINTILSMGENIVKINEILSSCEEKLEDLPSDLNTSEIKKKREKVNEICREGDYERALKIANEIPTVLDDLEESSETFEKETTEPESEIIEKVPSPESNDGVEVETEDIFAEKHSPRKEEKEEKTIEKEETEPIPKENSVEESVEELTNLEDQGEKKDEQRNTREIEEEQNEEGSIESTDIEDIIQETQTIESGSTESIKEKEKTGSMDVKDISEEIDDIKDEGRGTPSTQKVSSKDSEEEQAIREEQDELEDVEDISQEEADKKHEKLGPDVEGEVSEEKRTIEKEKESLNEGELDEPIEDKGPEDKASTKEVKELTPESIKDEEIDQIFETSFEINKKMKELQEIDLNELSRSEKTALLDKLEGCIGDLAEEEYDKASDNLDEIADFVIDDKAKEDETSFDDQRSTQKKDQKNSSTKNEQEDQQIESKGPKYTTTKMIFTMLTPFYSYFFPLALTILISIELITILSLSIAVVPIDLIIFLSPLPFLISRLVPQLLVSFMVSLILFITTYKSFSFEGKKLKISKKYILPCFALTILMTGSMGYHIYLSHFSFYKISNYLLFSLLLFLVSTQLDLLQNDFSIQD